MFKEGELHMQQYPVRTIDLEALRENVRLLRSTLPEKTKLMAVGFFARLGSTHKP